MSKKIRNAKGQFTSVDNAVSTANRHTQELIANALLSRQEFVNQFFDPRRNIDDECGYKSTANISSYDYKTLYDREAVAARVVELFPKESWKTTPTVFETEDPEEESAFETAWANVGKNLNFTEESSYEDEEGNPIWEYLKRADILSGIGSYGVMLLGVDDGKELNEPLDPSSGGEGTARKLLFIRVFDESLADITQWENDHQNVRFGKPVMYHLKFADMDSSVQSSIGAPTTALDVHYTRVVHLADNLGSNEVVGVPRMLSVFNNLTNLQKLYGGSAEMYWKGAFPGLSIESHPSLGGDVDVDPEALRGTMEQYQNGLQRYLAIIGMQVKSLAPQVVDPTPQIDVQLGAICINKGVPKRIFLGSERGELASSQDDKAWNERMSDRRSNYLTPRVIVPFIDTLINIGILPKPVSYNVVWPDLGTMSDDEKATVAGKVTEALAKYVGGSVESVIDPMDYLTRILDFTNDEATAILEAASEHMEEVHVDEDERMLEQQKLFPPEEGNGNGNGKKPEFVPAKIK